MIERILEIGVMAFGVVIVALACETVFNRYRRRRDAEKIVFTYMRKVSTPNPKPQYITDICYITGLSYSAVFHALLKMESAGYVRSQFCDMARPRKRGYWMHALPKDRPGESMVDAYCREQGLV